MKKLLCIACIAAFALTACTKKGADAIRVGVAGPLTGDQAVFGQDQLNGVKLAVEEVNAKGGILGKKVVIVEGDDQHDPKQAVSVANKFVNENVIAVVGHFNSSCSIPASKVYSDASIPMISHGSTNPKLTDQGFSGIFRVCGRDDQQGKVAADYVVNVMKAKKVVILHDKTTYGQGLADEFKKGVEGKVEVALYEGIVQGEKDYTPTVTKVKTLKPDMVFFGGIYVEAGLLIKQYKAIGGSAPFMGGDGIHSPELIKIGGKATEGTFATFGPDTKFFPSAKDFNENYRKKFGEPGVYSAYAYDAARIIFQALEKSGSTETKKLIAEIKNIDYKGALGSIRFDGKGDVLEAPYVMWKAEKGAFVQIK